MINLMEMKKQRQREQQQQQQQQPFTSLTSSNEPISSSSSSPPTPVTSAAQLRLQKDVTGLALPDTMSVRFPDPNDLSQFHVTLRPDEGFYKGGRFLFTFHIKPDYPHEPPKIHCTQRIYHPNIDLDGNVCLNILREDWNPVLDLNAVLYGLQFLFLEPNPEDPLNKEAAETLTRNINEFRTIVYRSMRGESHNGIVYDRVLVHGSFIQEKHRGHLPIFG
jgi:ubiquitin-conjugating enzyme E2 M